MPNYIFHTSLTRKALIDLECLIEKHDRYEAVYICQREGMDIDRATFWYRAMPEDEYQMLEEKNRLFFADHPLKKGYGGIATNYNYVSSQRGYFSRRSPATHVIEFKTPGPGFLYREFSFKGIPLKAEGDGGTYGLGVTGSQNGIAGIMFNKFLAQRVITWRVVALKKNVHPN
ncbi:TPA: hypothetical protein PMK43_003542 [Vibrio cholerae]|nr:hypothetical protein [Vibrio cholerae]HAS4543465.1 hypothetical protein [Vibrio cholerae]HDI3145853.1 hypothetical protein [Vibrio cholerae]HDI3312302.1 hypothetical protein [Vibrio cholerae]HDI3346243.1 hypothetical protein [Vibrio cholerae]